MPTLLSPSPNVSSEDSDWTDLPEAESLPDLAPPSATAVDPPLPGACSVCGDVIVREPGSRGRLPKYHPQCRPLKSTSSATPSAATSRRNSKAEAEATECVAVFQQAVIKAAIMLSVIDRFDAFCLMVALPNICENLKGILIRYDSLRQDMLGMKTGGSIIGFVLAVGMLLLPVSAHHGLLGRGKTAQLLLEMPFTLLKIQQRLKEGSEALTKLMEEQLREAAAANRRQAEEAAKVRAAHNGGS